MTNEFIVHIGSIIREYLEASNINEQKCAEILGINEKDLKNLLDGKAGLTDELAEKLTSVFPEIPSSYWINYENKYHEFIENQNLTLSQYNSHQLSSFAKRFKFNEIFSGLGWDLNKQANEMLKLLGLNNFEQFDDIYTNLNIDFMEDGGEKEAIAIWLNLAKEEIDLQNKDLSKVNYNKEKLMESLDRFKLLALNNDYKKSLKSARKLLNRLGIYLVFYNAIENSKVRGAVTTYNNKPAIFISGRFKTHDHTWFALMHEIGHLVLHYVPGEQIITMENEVIEYDVDKKEFEANKFARDFFINESAYTQFVSNMHFDEHTIRDFAQTQDVLPGIVLARLQHDGYISFDKLNYLKDR
ncbi:MULTISPECIES: ImmA/IrrE family metallo-endopeptidase [Lysinibacillus]|uniref:ImmA/IrrE family metallo-endopeptidase n=1 Tax=Lysinibacillus TaxID=400634 RepID=UPI00214AC6E5|nr:MULTISPECIES: ImmA/IrrE family metallo-endopeptidase [Lysinibacillus]UUV27096.1 ImmA/IrrE family metallo-endopeptidase [Lysinibacillus sp. FN11]UYB45358.1 ImmA/IrrE family metallo-endopeptidase [Lysinibacillus capsici]